MVNMILKKKKQYADETAEYFKKSMPDLPEIGIITGTGLGRSIASIHVIKEFKYRNIPHFPVTTVKSHEGRMLFGDMHGTFVMAMQGRFHLYEGYSSLDVTFPVRVMQELGVKILIIINAAGGINRYFNSGDIMVITDHINLTGSNPLVGPNEDSWGSRFPDMAGAYDKKLIQIVEKGAEKSGINLQKGVYAGLKGPSLETPAEIRFLKGIGADAVGFSTVMEVIAAVHGGIKVTALSAITNVHDPDNPVPATVDKIIAVAEKAASRIDSIVKYIVKFKCLRNITQVSHPDFHTIPTAT